MNKLTMDGSGVEYVVVEEYTHPRVGSPSFDNFHTYSSLEKAVEVVNQFPIKEGDGVYRSGRGYEYPYTTTAHLTQRLDADPKSDDKGTYFAICTGFRGKTTRVSKHISFSKAHKVVEAWQKREPLGDAYVTKELAVKVSYEVVKE